MYEEPEIGKMWMRGAKIMQVKIKLLEDRGNWFKRFVMKFQNKFRAKKTTVDGITFDSKKEADYYCELCMRRCAGEVIDFDLQVPFELQPSFKWQGKTIRAIKYVADFVVQNRDGTEEVVDVKGVRTETYKVKKKLFQYKYPNLKFKEV